MLFDILSNLPSLAGLRTHIIATMRSDYLPELFAHSDLYNIAKQGIDLRAMSIKELKEALQRPLQATYPDGKKQWEPALVDRLAQDTAPDAAYLPLLQVTLEDIWDKGRLTLDQYETLGNAIEERANRIFACKSAGTPQQTERSITPNDCPDGQEARSPQEQAMILQLLLSLVNVSLDDDPRRDVRRRRLKADLVDHQPEHERLIDELVTARLLSVTIETQGDSQVEMVDIIHETLIGNWDRLQQAIKEKRLELQQRTRFDQALQEWLANNRSDKYLLPEVRLAEARELDKRGDVALRDPAARSLLTLSNAQQTKKQQQEVDRLRKTIVAIAFVALLALAAVVFAVILGQQAVDARDQATAAESTALTEATRAVKAESTAEAEAIRAVKAESTALAEATRAVKAESTALAEATRAVKAESTAEAEAIRADEQSKALLAEKLVVQASNLLEKQFDLAFLLSLEAVHFKDSGVSRGNLLTALEDNAPILVLLHTHIETVSSVAFSPDGKMLASGNTEGNVILWDVATRQRIGQPLSTNTGSVNSVAFSPDGKILASGSYNTVVLWDVATRQPITLPVSH